MMIHQYNVASGKLIAAHELTDELCATIAKFNSYRTPEQVKADLTAGHSVYTSFSYYAQSTYSAESREADADSARHVRMHGGDGW
jgi:hypothetical protein